MTKGSPLLALTASRFTAMPTGTAISTGMSSVVLLDAAF